MIHLDSQDSRYLGCQSRVFYHDPSSIMYTPPRTLLLYESRFYVWCAFECVCVCWHNFVPSMFARVRVCVVRGSASPLFCAEPSCFPWRRTCGIQCWRSIPAARRYEASTLTHLDTTRTSPKVRTGMCQHVGRDSVLLSWCGGATLYYILEASGSCWNIRNQVWPTLAFGL